MAMTLEALWIQQLHQVEQTPHIHCTNGIESTS